jgi:hypothetical protein
VAELAGAQLYGRDQDRATARLLADHTNLAAAFEFSKEQGAVESMRRMIDALFYYFIVRGLVGEGRRWSRAALDVSDGDSSLRARAWLADGHLAVFGGQFLEAARSAAAATDTYRTIGNDAGLVRAEGLAAELTAIADPTSGIAPLHENLVRARQVGDVGGSAKVCATSRSPASSPAIPARRRPPSAKPSPSPERRATTSRCARQAATTPGSSRGRATLPRSSTIWHQ